MAQPSSAVRNIVLVHGAFADGSCWWRIIALLEDQGYSVVAVQNPLTSLADDAAAVRRIMALQDGPMVLVGHSWGGAVITEAGDDPQVAALVCVSAHALDVGQSANDASAHSDGPKKGCGGHRRGGQKGFDETTRRTARLT